MTGSAVIGSMILAMDLPPEFRLVLGRILGGFFQFVQLVGGELPVLARPGEPQLGTLCVLGALFLHVGND